MSTPLFGGQICFLKQNRLCKRNETKRRNHRKIPPSISGGIQGGDFKRVSL